MSKNILVTGGAGYIGSHVCKLLRERGFNPISFDNLSRSHSSFAKYGPLVVGDLRERSDILFCLKEHKIHAVAHLAGYAYVGESMENPSMYYMNNLLSTMLLLDCMNAYGIKNIVFSSSCAVYGIPVFKNKYVNGIPYLNTINETVPVRPISPYGHSKAMCEQIIRDYSAAYGMNYVNLRFFNAAGADPSGEIGESHYPETHLIPLLLEAALHEDSVVNVFGTDYATPDGTAIRDYVHVNDIARAHYLALEHMFEGPVNESFNLSNSRGFSVQQIISTVMNVTRRIPYVCNKDRRPGDPGYLVGCSDKIKEKFGWEPEYTNINDVVLSAWNWHKKMKSEE